MLLAPIGFITFQVWLGQHTGEPGAWFRVQREAWDEGASFGWTAIRNTVEAVWQPMTSPTDTITALSFVATVILVVLAWKAKMPWVLHAYSWSVVVLMLVPATVTARPRFLFTAFPLLIGAAQWYEGRRERDEDPVADDDGGVRRRVGRAHRAVRVVRRDSVTEARGPWFERPFARTAAVLALLAYLPALTAAPGRMPSDSKLYLYLDPGRFFGDAASTFDARQFAGWVPHQHVAYLWPSTPWFWMFDTLGVPDWIAHRLWIGTIMLAAGLGVRWCARLLGLGAIGGLRGRDRLPGVALRPALRVADVRDAAAVGGPRLDRRLHGPCDAAPNLGRPGGDRARRADGRCRERHRAGDDRAGAGALAGARGVATRRCLARCRGRRGAPDGRAVARGLGCGGSRCS